MKARLFLFIFVLGLFSFTAGDERTRYFPRKEVKVEKLPQKKNVWVFILAGQSNMSGRGLVEPQDTIPSERVFTINRNGEIILAKEPLHFYEPTMKGLGCGLSFGKAIVEHVPANVSVLLIPTAIGGSSISQWLGDSLYRNVHLMSNFREKVALAKKYGNIKGILWHQGESDANPKNALLYKERLTLLFSEFRKTAANKRLPILIGELGSYSKNIENWKKINEQIRLYASADRNASVISTADFKDKGDGTHFNSEGQRTLGKRFATEYLKHVK
jgi:hypothetical protein